MVGMSRCEDNVLRQVVRNVLAEPENKARVRTFVEHLVPYLVRVVVNVLNRRNYTNHEIDAEVVTSEFLQDKRVWCSNFLQETVRTTRPCSHVWTVARNYTIDIIRRDIRERDRIAYGRRRSERGHELETCDDLDSLPSNQPDPEAGQEYADILRRLHWEIQSLPESEQLLVHVVLVGCVQMPAHLVAALARRRAVSTKTIETELEHRRRGTRFPDWRSVARIYGSTHCGMDKTAEDTAINTCANRYKQTNRRLRRRVGF